MKFEIGASLLYLIGKNINNIKSVLFPVLLKVCLGILKSQSSKLEGLSALLRRSKALPMRHASSTLFFWCFLKKMKACLGTIFFIRKINESLKITTHFWRKWHQPLIDHRITILKILYYTIFCLHIKIFTILLPFAFILFNILIEPYYSFWL